MAVVSVPGALANGVLAGVNPVYGLYSLIAGTTTAALFTSSVIMNVDSTSAIALATIARMRRESLRPPPGQTGRLVAAGLFSVFGFNILTAFGQVSSSFQYLVNSWTTIVELQSIHKRLAAF